MAKFRYAWCKDPEMEMSPEDVTDFIVQKGKKPELMCPDEICRQEMPDTRIVSVCCDPGNPCSPKYFRTHPDHKHGPNCQYGFLSEQTDYVLTHKREYRRDYPDATILRDDLADIDTDLLPDEFIEEFAPREFSETLERRARQFMQAGKSRKEAVRRARCVVPQKTSRLGLIVDMAIRLDKIGDKKRQTVPLRLPDRPTANYNNAFFEIKFLRQEYTTPYIFCGETTAVATADGFIVEYVDHIRNYLPEYPDLPACTPIDSSYRPMLLKQLAEYADNHRHFYLYSFSKHALRESSCPISEDIKRCVVIEPKTRDSVVIKSRCLKREENRTR